MFLKAIGCAILMFTSAMAAVDFDTYGTKGLAAGLAGCVECDGDICYEGNRASLWQNGVCMFDSYTTQQDVFSTGHILNLGSCAASSLRVGKRCFDNISASIALNLADSKNLGYDTVCRIVPIKTPCIFNSRKFVVTATGAECSVVKSLADNAVEDCLRNKADARFWATLFYLIAVVFFFIVVPVAISICCRYK